MEGVGFEPTKAGAGRFTVCSLWPLGYPSERSPSFVCLPKFWLSKSFSTPPVAGAGIRTPDLLITNQLLYQLSYTGKRRTYSKLGWTTTPARGPETTTLLTAKHPN